MSGLNAIAAAQFAKQASAPVAAAAPAPAEGFAEQVASAIENVNDAQQSGDSALKSLASGEDVDLHGVMVALEKADISLRTMVSVRNRVVAAYEQVMNMAI